MPRLRVLRLDDTPVERLRSRGMMSLVGLVSQSAARFLTNWLAGRLGGPIALGQISVAMSSVQLLSLLGPTSLGAATSRYLAAAAGEGDLAATRAMARHLWRTAAIAGLLLGLLGGAIWGIGFGGSVIESATVGFLVVGLTGYTMARGSFFGHRHVVAGGWWDVACALAAVIGVAVLFLSGVRSVLALVPLGVTWLVYAWAGWPRSAQGALSPERRAEINRFVLVTTMGTLASSGFIQSSQVVARLVGGEVGAGHYSAAFTLAAPLTILVGAANQVLFPSLAEALGRDDVAGFRRQLHQMSAIVALLSGGAVGALVVASGSIIDLVWGEQFREARQLLPVLLLAVLANAVAVPAISAQVVRGAQAARAMTVFSLIGLLAGTITWVLAAPRLGLVGVGAGYLVGTTTTMILTLARAHRVEEQRLGGLLVRLGLLVALALVGWAVCRPFGVPATVAATAAYLLAWTALSAPQLRRIWHERLGRGPSTDASADPETSEPPVPET